MKYPVMIVLVILPSLAMAEECKLHWHGYCNQGRAAFTMPSDKTITSVIEAASGPELAEIIPNEPMDLKLECYDKQYSSDEAAMSEVGKLMEDCRYLELTGLFYGAAAPATGIVVRLGDGTRIITASGFHGLFCIIDKDGRRWYSRHSG